MLGGLLRHDKIFFGLFQFGNIRERGNDAAYLACRVGVGRFGDDAMNAAVAWRHDDALDLMRAGVRQQMPFYFFHLRGEFSTVRADRFEQNVTAPHFEQLFISSIATGQFQIAVLDHGGRRRRIQQNMGQPQLFRRNTLGHLERGNVAVGGDNAADAAGRVNIGGFGDDTKHFTPVCGG